jgi:hypothetical protein
MPATLTSAPTESPATSGKYTTYTLVSGLKIGISPKVKIKKAKADATANTKAPNFASLENLIGLIISTTKNIQTTDDFTPHVLPKC